jgi:hypothetical protein
VTRHPGRNPDAKISGNAFAVLPHGRSQLGHELQHLAPALDHVLSLGRESHLAGRPIEETRAELLLELRDRVADSRGAQQQRAPSPCKACGIGHPDKNLDLPQLVRFALPIDSRSIDEKLSFVNDVATSRRQPGGPLQ